MVMVVMTGVVVGSGLRGLGAGLVEELGGLAVAALHMDRFSIVLQSARGCTVGAVGKAGGLVNDKGARF